MSLLFWPQFFSKLTALFWLACSQAIVILTYASISGSNSPQIVGSIGQLKQSTAPFAVDIHVSFLYWCLKTKIRHKFAINIYAALTRHVKINETIQESWIFFFLNLSLEQAIFILNQRGAKTRLIVHLISGVQRWDNAIQQINHHSSTQHHQNPLSKLSILDGDLCNGWCYLVDKLLLSIGQYFCTIKPY